MVPVVFHLELKRQKKESNINKELWLIDALDRKLERYMKIYTSHNYKVRNGYWPTAEDFNAYGNAKKEMDKIYLELRECDKRLKEHMLEERKLSWEIQEISLQHFLKQAFELVRG